MKIGTTELLIILVVVIIIFGPTQIPKLTRMIGKSVKEFRKGVEGDEDSSSTTDAAATDKIADNKVNE